MTKILNTNSHHLWYFVVFYRHMTISIPSIWKSGPIKMENDCSMAAWNKWWRLQLHYRICKHCRAWLPNWCPDNVSIITLMGLILLKHAQCWPLVLKISSGKGWLSNLHSNFTVWGSGFLHGSFWRIQCSAGFMPARWTQGKSRVWGGGVGVCFVLL